jgi:hypothetical protein
VAGFRVARRSSLVMRRRSHSLRFPSPARSSMSVTTSAGKRSATSTVSTLRFNGGRPMRRVVADSCKTVNANSVALYAIDPCNV